MTQSEKDILLKDLCSRLPYGVKGEKYTIRMDGEFVPLIDVEVIIAEDIITLNGCPGYMIRPYLFPLSSMTEEQKEELNDITNLDIEIAVSHIKNDTPNYVTSLNRLAWLLKNHFDIYDLIPMGLANDATGLNIY